MPNALENLLMVGYRLAACAAPDAGQAFARQLQDLVHALPGWTPTMVAPPYARRTVCPPSRQQLPA